MKPVGRVSKLLACGVALAAVWLVSSAEAATGRAVVRTVRGTASSAEQGGDWTPLKTGQALGPGATVRTGVDGIVNLFLGENGPDVRLYESTSLGLDRLNIERTGTDSVVETQLNLTAGTIKGKVRRLSAASKYEVKTPNAVVGVRSEAGPVEYVISANGVVHVLEGSVMVVYINPSSGGMSTHTVGSGQTFAPPVNPSATGATPVVRDTRPDEVPEEPVTPPGGPTVVVVPTPEPHVSPVQGPSAGSSSSTSSSPGTTD
jgi:hypothetical protein